MRIDDQEDEDRPELNVTPLIDCLFFLLTFFVMTSTLQEVQKSEGKAVQQLALDLPEATAARAAPAATTPVVIQVDATGRYYLRDQRIGIEELHREVRAAGEAHAHIRIDGDRDAPFEYVARVVDLCEFEGLRDFSIRTRDR
jgi:biopolymer transport protein ExbD